MALINLLSCLALCFLPHVVYYNATPLAEFGVLPMIGQAVLFQTLNTAFKMVLLACLLPGAELINLDMWQDIAQLLVTMTDLLGLYFALTTKWVHKGISNEHKFQAVGLGWAFGDSLLRRLMPMWVSGFSPEFSMDNVIEAVRSNVVLVHSLSFAAIGSLVFNKRGTQGLAAAFLKLVLILLTLLPFIASMVERSKGLNRFGALGVEAGMTVFAALICWELASNAAKKQN